MSNILAVTHQGALAVTKSDTVNDVAGPFSGLFVAVAGLVRFVDMLGNEVTTGSIAAGTTIPIAAVRVFSTTTTATVYGLRAPPFKPPAGS